MSGPRRERLRVNLGRLLEQQAKIHAGKSFVTQAETGESLTYDGFNNAVNRVGHGLRDLGVEPGQYASIMLPNGLAFLETAYALKKIGAVEVAINRDFRGVALGRMLRLTHSPILVTSGEYLNALLQVRSSLQHIERLVMVDDADRAEKFFPGKSVVRFEEMLSSCTDDFDPDAMDTDVAVILFTSGTTGVSKGCMLPHRNAIRAAESMIRAFDLTDRDCVYSPYPLFHVGAAHYDVLPALMVGGRAVIRRKFSVSAFWDDVVEYGATWAMMLGSAQQLLWAAPQCKQETAHILRFVWGTPLPVDPDAFEERFNLKVARGGGYGSTDAGSVAMPLLDRPGGLVLDNYEVGIVDSDGAMAPAGAEGELVVRELEPGIMSAGYFGMPGETRETRRDGWFHTGDVARLDDEGYLHFVGRMSERIRVLGEMVSAYEVEETVLSHPAVEDCAVIGVPSQDGEESIRAFVTLRPGKRLTDGDLRSFCAANMSRFMVPGIISFLDSMPRTPSGKPAKSLLRNMA